MTDAERQRRRRALLRGENPDDVTISQPDVTKYSGEEPDPRKVAWAEHLMAASAMSMAADLVRGRGPEYCHQLIEHMLTVLHWDWMGRPDPYPFAVQADHTSSPPSYGLVEIKADALEKEKLT